MTALAFLSGGTKVAVADGGKALRILDVTTGKEETAFEAKDDVRALAITADGKRLATAGASGTVLLWDAATGRQERRFSAKGAIHALALSPDGKRLVIAGEEGALLWDLTRDEKPLPRDFKLSEKELDTLWADLASAEGGKAYAAFRMLRADPARSVSFLQDRLKRNAKGPDRNKLKQLLADLDSDDFSTREAATNELEMLGPRAESALRAALAAAPPLEVKIRVERLLKLGDQARALTAEQQRDVRALQVLEQAGTPEARKLLETLVNSSPDWWVARQANEALQRLSQGDKKR